MDARLEQYISALQAIRGWLVQLRGKIPNVDDASVDWKLKEAKVLDWDIRNEITKIDRLRKTESDEERSRRLYCTSPSHIEDSEIQYLPPESQERVRKFKEKVAREAACPGHEAEAEPVSEYSRMRGWHPAHCKHCGMDMSVDSGD